MAKRSRRQTRRGRAKRWTGGRMRGLRIRVCPMPARSGHAGMWRVLVNSGRGYRLAAFVPSKASASQIAEHWARFLRPKSSTWAITS